MFTTKGGELRLTNALRVKRGVIFFRKDLLSPEDELALKFSEILKKQGIKYVIVAGYLTILFGRGRKTDDIDFLIERLSLDDFIKLCSKAKDVGFELIQGDINKLEDLKIIYHKYLQKGHRIRFILHKTPIPNVKFKFITTEFDKIALKSSIKVFLEGIGEFLISPLELQIAYKLRLGSNKDLEDARFLYELFYKIINRAVLKDFCRMLKVDKRWLKLIQN